MRTELPVCKRCCFCLPLRYGLITWGYIRLSSLSKTQVHVEANTSTEEQTPLQCFPFDDKNIFRPSHNYEIPASSMFLFAGMFVTFYGILEMSTEGNDPMNIVYTAILGFLVLLTVTDLVLNTIFIVGGHTKNLKLLRAYYIYSFIICILTCIIGIASGIYTLLLFKIGEIDLTFHIWVVLVDTASLLAQVLGQVYVLLLVRSEIIKLRSHCEFRFVNNAAEAECTLKCEEINGEEGPEYTYERYAPELCNDKN